MTPDLRPARIVIAPPAPFADGICFDDCYGLTPAVVRMLRGRGLVWLTRFRVSNPGAENFYPSGYVIAASWAQAAAIADARGLGETVLGQWECCV